MLLLLSTAMDASPTLASSSVALCCFRSFTALPHLTSAKLAQKQSSAASCLRAVHGRLEADRRAFRLPTILITVISQNGVAPVHELETDTTSANDSLVSMCSMHSLGNWSILVADKVWARLPARHTDDVR